MLYTHDRAIILNDLANTYAIKMRYTKAIERYHEALALYLHLAKDEPLVYSIHIAHIFSNLSIIYLNLNQKEKSTELHANALKVHRALARQNFQKYAIGCACCIIDGVDYLNEHSFMLYEAEIILKRFQKNCQVKELLESIDVLRT